MNETTTCQDCGSTLTWDGFAWTNNQPCDMSVSRNHTPEG